MKKNKILLMIGGIGIALLALLVRSNVWGGAGSSNVARGQTLTVYKSPTCGCCTNYVAYLKREGFGVTVVEQDDLSLVKQTYGIPRELQSCHTSVMGNYAVEGHVPVAALEQLIAQQPAFKAIALPDMPQGSPGMPGVKREQFNVFGINAQGDYSMFMNL